MSHPDTIVIVPTYNEADNIDELLSQLLALPVDLGVLVVDDNSPDGTGEMVDKWVERHPERVFVVHRSGKLGLGTAYIAGFNFALDELHAGRIMTMDADFSHNPRYIPSMIDLSASKDVVIGSRYVAGGGSRNCTWKRIWLSIIANFIARTLAWSSGQGYNRRISTLPSSRAAINSPRSDLLQRIFFPGGDALYVPAPRLGHWRSSHNL